MNKDNKVYMFVDVEQIETDLRNLNWVMDDILDYFKDKTFG